MPVQGAKISKLRPSGSPIAMPTITMSTEVAAPATQTKSVQARVAASCSLSFSAEVATTNGSMMSPRTKLRAKRYIEKPRKTTPSPALPSSRPARTDSPKFVADDTA